MDYKVRNIPEAQYEAMRNAPDSINTQILKAIEAHVDVGVKYWDVKRGHKFTYHGKEYIKGAPDMFSPSTDGKVRIWLEPETIVI